MVWLQDWKSSLPLELQNALAGGTAPAVTTTPGDYTASSSSYAPEVPTSPTSLVDSRTGRTFPGGFENMLLLASLPWAGQFAGHMVS